jgi:membrane fusion protein, adhesin transport system
MEIVPMDEVLMAEIKISPNDIGNVEEGQPCLVKVSAYDFSRWGGIEGELVYISATTFISKEGVPFYKGRIKLEKNYVGKDPTKNIVHPGFIVNVNIITGEKSIMSYLLKPIKNALSVSFSEK